MTKPLCISEYSIATTIPFTRTRFVSHKVGDKMDDKDRMRGPNQTRQKNMTEVGQKPEFYQMQ